MGLGETWRSWWRGDSTGTALGYAFVSQAEIDRGRKLDEALAAQNARAYDIGLWSEDQYEQASGRLAAGATDELFRRADTSPWEGFKEGWSEGASSMTGAVRDTLTGTLKTLLSAIPWWLYVGALLYLLWRLGLLRRLLRT